MNIVFDFGAVLFTWSQVFCCKVFLNLPTPERQPGTPDFSHADGMPLTLACWTPMGYQPYCAPAGPATARLGALVHGIGDA